MWQTQVWFNFPTLLYLCLHFPRRDLATCSFFSRPSSQMFEFCVHKPRCLQSSADSLPAFPHGIWFLRVFAQSCKNRFISREHFDRKIVNRMRRCSKQVFISSLILCDSIQRIFLQPFCELIVEKSKFVQFSHWRWLKNLLRNSIWLVDVAWKRTHKYSEVDSKFMTWTCAKTSQGISKSLMQNLREKFSCPRCKGPRCICFFLSSSYCVWTFEILFCQTWSQLSYSLMPTTRNSTSCLSL